MIDKQDLRTMLRAARDRAGEAELPVPDAFIARLVRGATVASYHPIGSEADPSPLERAAIRAGCALALSHVVDRSRPLRFLAWSAGATLVAGPFGLSQPPESAEQVDPDIILTPLVGFDRRGNRLGQGAGYYDRAFLRHPQAWRVGVARAVQEVETLPIDAWDVPLHAIVTEREWITP
jgi:5-formyltetrahydrofolate cyclo-ligase